MHWISLPIFIAICMTAAASGASFPPDKWYEGLRKPSWQPPPWAFPLVWTVLYIMIAVSGWLVWTRGGGKPLGGALTCYAVQIVLNAAWSPLFFGLKRMDLAFYVAIAMFVAIAVTIWQFMPIDKVAAYLLFPYLAWVCVAAFLNWTVWKLNPAESRGMV